MTHYTKFLNILLIIINKIKINTILSHMVYIYIGIHCNKLVNQLFTLLLDNQQRKINCDISVVDLIKY
jgi:hypothetical protein